MARRPRRSGFETCTAQLKLAIRKKPATVLLLAPGVALLYRRSKRNGAWVVKVLAGEGRSKPALPLKKKYLTEIGGKPLVYKLFPKTKRNNSYLRSFKAAPYAAERSKPWRDKK